MNAVLSFIQDFHGLPAAYIDNRAGMQYAELLKVEDEIAYLEFIQDHTELADFNDDLFLASSIIREQLINLFIARIFKDKLIDDINEYELTLEENEDQLNRALFDAEEARSINQEYATA